MKNIIHYLFLMISLGYLTSCSIDEVNLSERESTQTKEIQDLALNTVPQTELRADAAELTMASLDSDQPENVKVFFYQIDKETKGFHFAIRTEDGANMVDHVNFYNNSVLFAWLSKADCQLRWIGNSNMQSGDAITARTFQKSGGIQDNTLVLE